MHNNSIYSNNSIEKLFSKYTEYSRVNLPIDIIKKNFKLPTQLNKTFTFIIPEESFNYFFPTFNKKYQYNKIVTNAIYSNRLAIDNLSTLVQVPTECNASATKFHTIEDNKRFISTLNNNIR